MEQTTLQQRIEKRAEDALKRDLVATSNMEKQIQQMFGMENYSPRILANYYYGSNRIELRNEFTKELFSKLLPK